MQIGDPLPPVDLATPDGDIGLTDIVAGDWAALVYHPMTCPEVCASDLAALAQMGRWARRTRVQIISIVPEKPARLPRFTATVERAHVVRIGHPVLSDPDGHAADTLGLAPARACGQRPAGTLIVSPAGQVRLMERRPGTIGLSRADLTRRIDALTLVEHGECVAPADWTLGAQLLDRAGARL